MFSKKNVQVVIGLLMIATLLLSACAQAPAEPIIQTVVVTQVVEKEGETVVETQIVEVEVTPTPAPEEGEEPFTPIHPEFKNPDTFVVVDGAGEQQTLDPAWTYESRGGSIELNIYEGMVTFEREKTDAFIPMLATDWEINDTGDVWTFNIREGVTFHEGGTLEPHDVAYSVHRALLQDRLDGPHWMTLEAFFGLYTVEDMAMEIGGVDSFDSVSASALVETCEQVKTAVVADDEAGTVTFTLNQPTPWFLAIMANTFLGATLDQEWMVEQGDWDGSCDTWVDFHDPLAQDSLLFDRANGTGPYMLDHWTPGEETVLVANPNYWRTEPMWEGGPSGVASIKRVVLKNITEPGTRLAMLEAGDADYIYVPAQYRPQLFDYIQTKCDLYGTCEEANPEGYIKAMMDLPSPAMTPAQFNWNINVEGGNPYVGSGALDGSGIPPEFFQDEHVRKAFNWCFDWDILISDILDGDAIQAQGPIIAGMMGYRDEDPLYHFDADKCVEEFQAAWDGQVWENGFYMQIGYNQGNAQRQGLAEILKAGVESVNPKFDVEVLTLPWPVLLDARRAGKLPVYIGGWIEDFHDPHNWVQPFLYSSGTYGRVVNIASGDPEEAAAFDQLIEEGASLTTAEERRPIYEEIQLKAQEDAVMLWGYQQVLRYHYQSWMDVPYINVGLPQAEYAYIYALDKVAP